MVLRIRGFHQQRFNSIISRFFPAGRGHMMNLERCPVAIPLQASRAPRTDPPIVSVIPSIRTFPNAPRSHSVSARKGNSQVPKVRYRTRFDKDTEPINNNNTEVLSNKRAGEINDILDGWTTQAASRGPASGSPGGIAAAKINLALGQTHF